MKTAKWSGLALISDSSHTQKICIKKSYQLKLINQHHSRNQIDNNEVTVYHIDFKQLFSALILKDEFFKNMWFTNASYPLKLSSNSMSTSTIKVC